MIEVRPVQGADWCCGVQRERVCLVEELVALVERLRL